MEAICLVLVRSMGTCASQRWFQKMALPMGAQDRNKLCELFYHVHGGENAVYKLISYLCKVDIVFKR